MELLDGRPTLNTARFEAHLFARDSESRFSRQLPPDATDGPFIVELRPRPGQDAQSLTHWLEKATVGSDAMLPLLKRCRLPGATCTTVNVRDFPGLKVQDDAQVFCISVCYLDVDGKSVSAIAGGRRMLIVGAEGAQGPSEMIWHQAVTHVAGRSSQV